MSERIADCRLPIADLKSEIGNRKSEICLTAFLLILCLTCEIFASVTYDDIIVSVESPFSGESFHGYVEHSISVTNSSETLPHTVTLVAPKNSYGGRGDYIEAISRSVVVPPASSATVPLLQPPVAIRGEGIAVIIDGQRQRETVPFHSRHCSSYSSHFTGPGPMSPVCVLLSRNVSLDDFDKGIEKAYAPGGVARPPGSYYSNLACNFVRAEAPVTGWNTNWLAYSCYDGIVATAGDMRSMPLQVQAVILQYIQCGGTLLVLDSWEPPESWMAVKGAGDLFDLRHVGFGICAINRRGSPDTDNWDVDKFKFLREQVWSLTSSPMVMKKSIFDTNVWFPVVATIATPIRGLFVLVMFFAVVIGPVNLLILSRKNRRIWMLWTVPMLSVIASLFVISYAFYAEGWRGHVRTQAITLLDETSRRAGTIAISAFYCPLMPKGGLHFDYETEVTPTVALEYREGSPKSVNWTADQHLSSGWISARVPAHFFIRKSQMRRERVKITANGSNVEAMNGLGADIKRLWYSDGRGRIYEAVNIVAGAKVSLKYSSAGSTPQADALRKVFSSNWPGGADEIARQPQKYLRPDSYIAVLESTPFVEQPLKNPKSTNLKSVVIGFRGGSADAD